MANTTEQLIPVIKTKVGDDLIDTCDARALHTYLGSGDRFADWIKARIERYKFQENQDFVCVSAIAETQRKSGQHGISKRIDYHITVNMAKQLAMVENNDKGLEARQYFIRMEEIAIKAAAQPKGIFIPDFTDPAAAATAWANEYNEKQKALEGKRSAEALAQQRAAQLEAVKPKVQYYDDMVADDKNDMRIGTVAKLLGVGEKELRNDLINSIGWCFRDGNNSLVPYSDIMHCGYCRVKEGYYPKGCPYVVTTITRKGCVKLYEIYGRDDLIRSSLLKQPANELVRQNAVGT